MASIRELKKDIDYLVYELIADCFAAMNVKHDEDVSDKLADIISEAVKLRNDLISRVRYREGKSEPDNTGEYYRGLRKELVTGIDALFEKMSKVVSS